MQLARHLEKVYYFRVLTLYRSINEGAAAIGISQAGLSKSISSLEEVLDVKLFSRGPKGLTLTKEGQLLLESAVRIFDDAADVERRLSEMKSISTPHRIRIGLYDSIAVYFLKDLSSYLARVHPKVELRLTVENTASIAQTLKSGGLDLAIVVKGVSHIGPAYIYRPLFGDCFTFFVAPSVKSSADSLPLLIHPGATDGEGRALQEKIRFTKSRVSHRIFNFETLRMLTIQGFGVGLMPDRVAATALQLKQLEALRGTVYPSSFGPHEIGMFCAPLLSDKHTRFLDDIARFATRWAMPLPRG